MSHIKLESIVVLEIVNELIEDKKSIMEFLQNLKSPPDAPFLVSSRFNIENQEMNRLLAISNMCKMSSHIYVGAGDFQILFNKTKRGGVNNE